MYGGTFGCEYAEGPGVWYVLAGDAASFKIYGGTFLNAEPAESQLASGCKVISDGAGKFDVTRNYSGNITLLDGTPVEGNTIVFADETTLQMIEVTDPNFGDKAGSGAPVSRSRCPRVRTTPATRRSPTGSTTTAAAPSG